MESPSQPAEELSFEEALKALENVVHQLEAGDVPLEEAINLYARGEALRSQCQKRLEAAQARIEKITLNREGQPVGTAPFDSD
jgi:exodeoxyribonuclease VII small subunit